MFPAPSTKFKEAIDSNDLKKAKDILHNKFKAKKLGDDGDARKFVDVLSKQSVDIQKEICKSAPVNFFIQQDSKKQNMFHNLAAFQEHGEGMPLSGVWNRGVEILNATLQVRNGQKKSN